MTYIGLIYGLHMAYIWLTYFLQPDAKAVKQQHFIAAGYTKSICFKLFYKNMAKAGTRFATDHITVMVSKPGSNASFAEASLIRKPYLFFSF
jgi:hypothetical protein